jgi:hypothetical protein
MRYETIRYQKLRVVLVANYHEFIIKFCEVPLKESKFSVLLLNTLISFWDRRALYLVFIYYLIHQ